MSIAALHICVVYIKYIVCVNDTHVCIELNSIELKNAPIAVRVHTGDTCMLMVMFTQKNAHVK